MNSLILTRTIVLALIPGCVWCGVVPPLQARDVALPDQQVAEVTKLLVGTMDTTAQARANPQAPSVRMTTCQIQVVGAVDRPQAVFLYQEQALTDQLTQPYRQRFLEIAAVQMESALRVRSLTFRPPHPDQWIGLCAQPPAQRVVQVNELGQPVCSVLLRPQAGGYWGETPAEGCPTSVRGAVRITNQVELFPAGMNTWDRGFDRQGQQVWGAESEAYQFRRN